MATDTKTVNKIINGVTVQWTAEGVAITPSDAAFGQVELIARKLTALVSATNELIDDNMSDTEVFTLITTLIGEAMAEFEDAQVLVGSGTGSNFAGIFTAGTAIQTSAITEAAPTFVEIVALKNKIPMKYRKANSRSLAFVMNQEMYSKVESMVDLEGRPLLKESFKRDQDEVTLLGYPVEVVDSAPVDKIAFGNFYFYLLGERRAMTLEQGYATGDFESDIKSLKASKRIAGAIVYKDAFVVSI